MRRARLSGMMLAMLALIGWLPAAAAAAAIEHRLAVDQPGQPTDAGGGGEPLPGPEPDPETTFAPKEYEAPWTWWLGVILTGVAVLMVGATGLGYWLLIARPRQRGRTLST